MTKSNIYYFYYMLLVTILHRLFQGGKNEKSKNDATCQCNGSERSKR